MSVVYAAYAAPGMMKMGLGCGSLGLEVGVGWEAVRSLEPRARVSVWLGRRRVPGIVAPDSWGARGAECLPRDVLRRSSPATSPCDGTTARRCLCHGTGPAPRKHAPPQAVYPRRLMGVWGFYRATRPIPGRIFGAVHHYSRCQFIIIRGQFGVTGDNSERVIRCQFIFSRTSFRVIRCRA